MRKSFVRTLLLTAAFLSVSWLTAPGLPAAAAAQDAFGPVDCAALAQTTADPAWLSLPGSRLVVNPYQGQYFGHAGGSGGAVDGVLPVDLAYYVAARPVPLPALWFVRAPGAPATMGGPVAGPRLDLSDTTAWRADGVTAAFGGEAAQVTCDGDYGAITRTVTVDLGRTPTLLVQTPPGSPAVVMKVNDGSLPVDVALTPSQFLGATTADVAAATGWHGVKTFQVRLFVLGRGTSVTITRVQFFRLPTAPGTAGDTTLWRPDRLTADAQAPGGSGRLAGTLTMPDADTVTQRLRVGPGGPSALVLSGQFAGSVRWDGARSVLRLQGVHFCAVLAFSRPARWLGTRPTLLDWEMPPPANGDVPAATTGVWRLAVSGLRPGADLVVSARFTPSPDAPARLVGAARSQASPAAFAAALARNEAAWDRRLARVPRPHDFTPRRVDPDGVTAADVRRSYYRAWTFLLMDTLPPMPENDFTYPQVCAGKPALWVDGATHSEETATWDSVDAAQALALVDPQTCWRALMGVMSQVDADGYLNGESLPSVFARAFWLLYRQTGDKAALRAVYPAMKRHLLWLTANPHWIYPNRTKPSPDPGADKDQEYVVHEIADMGYAIKIAQTLGMPDEAAGWRRARAEAVADYQHWFWPQSGGPVYLIYRTDTLRGAPNNSWSLQGLELGPRLLPLSDQSALLALYGNTCNIGLPFLVPGRTRYGDLRPITLGLFACGRPDDAAQLADACLRDVTRAGEFSESYAQSEPPAAQGVRPSAFGACLMAGSVLWHNGVTLDEGLPVLLGMPGAVGVDNVPVQGLSLNIRFDGAAHTVTLNGPALARLRLPDGFRAVTANGATAWAGPIAEGQRVALAGRSDPEADEPE